MYLPQLFGNVKTALGNQPIGILTLDFVSQRLIDAEALLLYSRKEKVCILTAHDNTVFVLLT